MALALRRRYKRPAERQRKVLRPARANLGVAAKYKRLLVELIEEMERSTLYWIGAGYKANPPAVAKLAMDSSNEELRRIVGRMRRRWYKRFDELSQRLAEYFAENTAKSNASLLKRIFKDAGWTVEMRMTRAQQEIVGAAVNENVALIKSIPRGLLDKVEGHVMRSVQAGRDAGTLAQTLRTEFGSTKKRAALIARDQNNKVTSALSRARYLEMGLNKAIWVHSGAGKEPRPTHVKAGRDKVEFDLASGWYDPHEKKFIFPGELINCRCSMKPVIEGFS